MPQIYKHTYAVTILSVNAESPLDDKDLAALQDATTSGGVTVGHMRYNGYTEVPLDTLRAELTAIGQDGDFFANVVNQNDIQNSKDLRELLDYARNDDERGSFIQYLRDTGRDDDADKLDEAEDEDAEDWVRVCSDPAVTHIYAIAWRLAKSEE